jgi:formylglycine-generating enzyme required for sulfatase activity
VDDQLNSPDSGLVIIKPAAYQPPRRRRAKLALGRPLRWTGVTLVLISGLAVIWYLITAQPVVLQLVPGEALAELGPGFTPRVGHQWLLRPGQYQLRVSAPGYYDLEQSLEVGNDTPREHRIELEPLPGHLQVTSAPVSGANVFLDGEAAGKTPVTLREIAVGNHKVRVEAQRYLPLEQQVDIEGRDRDQQLEVTLQPAWAEISVSSEPSGAEIMVDDEVVGTTPMTAEIIQGKRQLRVRLDGYKTWQQDLTVTAGKAQNIADIKLQKADAIVALTTTPSGANVTVDGEFQGLSPIKMALSPGKAHTISMFKQGYGAATRQVTVNSGDRRSLQVALDAELAKVQFKADPADAELIIDGQSKGAANQLLFLPTRPHQIEIRKAGHATYKTTITPREGTPQLIDVRLPTMAEVKKATTKTIASAPGGQQLKLFTGGKVTMGASRREAGRRANEVIREVELTRPFYLGIKEVTNGDYRRFQIKHSSKNVQGHSLDSDGQPVVNVNWNEAAMYCNWLSHQQGLPLFYVIEQGKVRGFNSASTGYRLPTEAEWEWAARTVPGGVQLKYPWGDGFPPNQKVGNYADRTAADLVARIIPDYDDGFAVSTGVGRFPPNQHGLYDMSGNVAEWVHDLYDISNTGQGTVLRDPLGPTSGDYHVIRGASWAHGSITELRLSYRDYSNKPRDDVGFRIARYAE